MRDKRYDADPPWPECDHGPVRAWWDLPIMAVDTETTGPDPLDCRIVELGACWMPDGLSGDVVRFGMLIDPQCDIPEAATAVHGITSAKVRGCPTIDEVTDRFLTRVREAAVVVGYNLRSYDAVVLDRCMGGLWEMVMSDRVLLDALDVVRLQSVGRFWKGSGRHKLTSVAERFGMRWPSKGEHRASADAQMSLMVLHRLASRLPPCPRCADAWLTERHHEERERFEAWKAEQERKEAE